MNFGQPMQGQQGQNGLLGMLMARQQQAPGQMPAAGGLFGGLSAYNPEWLKAHQTTSGAMPYAQFAANNVMQAAGQAMPDLAAQQAEAERQREEWLRQQMAAKQPSNPYGYSDFDWMQKQAYGANSGGNGGA